MTVMVNATTAAGTIARDTGPEASSPILSILFILSNEGFLPGSNRTGEILRATLAPEYPFASSRLRVKSPSEKRRTQSSPGF